MGIEVMEVNVVENGEKYKELLTKILAYDNNLSDEDYKQVSYDFNDAGILCTKGIDDIYSELTYEAIKKAYYSRVISCGFIEFIERYIRRCLVSFSEKRNMLQQLIDFINTNMRIKEYEELEFYRKELENLVYDRYDGFHFVLITDELREKIRCFIQEKHTLLGVMMDWIIGVYNVKTRMFITQISQTMPGREVFEKKYRYVVFTDDGVSFIFNVTTMLGREDVYIIPRAYQRYEEELKEGVLLYRQRTKYIFSLPKDITEKFGEIIDNAHNKVNESLI